MPTPEQAQEILALLEGYEKQLSTDRLPQRLFLNILPAQFQSMEVQLPEWLEAAIFIWDPENQDDYFNLILGNGHVQIRDGYTYLPPYYEISNGQQLYQELDAIPRRGLFNSPPLITIWQHFSILYCFPCGFPVYFR